MSKHIACDLDGTLAHYDGWKGIHHIGEPIVATLNRVKAALLAGVEVTIFTARLGLDRTEHRRDAEATRQYIEEWCVKHVGRVLPITATKRAWFTEI